MRNLGGGICERFPDARRDSSLQACFARVFSKTRIFPHFLRPKFFLLSVSFLRTSLTFLSRQLHIINFPPSIADRKDNATPLSLSKRSPQISLRSTSFKNFCRGSPQKQVYEYQTITPCKRKLPNTTIDTFDNIQFTKAAIFQFSHIQVYTSGSQHIANEPRRATTHPKQ